MDILLDNLKLLDTISFEEARQKFNCMIDLDNYASYIFVGSRKNSIIFKYKSKVTLVNSNNKCLNHKEISFKYDNGTCCECHQKNEIKLHTKTGIPIESSNGADFYCFYDGINNENQLKCKIENKISYDKLIVIQRYDQSHHIISKFNLITIANIKSKNILELIRWLKVSYDFLVIYFFDPLILIPELKNIILEYIVELV